MSKIIAAIRYATQAHAGQKRKGKEDPYIMHPLSVGILLAHAGADEKVVIAGILHDTIEDTAVTREDLEKEFGEDIAAMVDDVTEQDKSLPWAERKKAALDHIPHMTTGSLMVKAADVMHNMTELIEDYKIHGDDMFRHFNASKEEQIERYQKLVKALRKKWSDNPLLLPLEQKLKELKKLQR